jgi:hypothetical protein
LEHAAFEAHVKPSIRGASASLSFRVRHIPRIHDYLPVALDDWYQ